MSDADASKPSLYERLGGEDKIKEVVKDAYALHASDPLSKEWFAAGKTHSCGFANTADAEHVGRLVFEFFCAGIGGPQTYTGVDMLERHKGMAISDYAFLAVCYHVLSSLQKHSAGGPAEWDEVAAILESLRPAIQPHKYPAKTAE
eukprot:m.27354 g.27354  ORF g.27354 m.27354 type:complete len:146 (-) comp8525_c0_seq2:132-569(-)